MDGTVALVESMTMPSDVVAEPLSGYMYGSMCACNLPSVWTVAFHHLECDVKLTLEKIIIEHSSTGITTLCGVTSICNP